MFTKCLGRLVGATLLLMISSAFCDTNNDFVSLGKSSETFASNVYQKLSSTPGNLLISPLSIQTILALVQTGANGTTLKQMSKTLSLPSDKTKLIEAFGNLNSALKKVEKITLNSANKVYVREDINLSESFKKSAVHFNAEVENIEPKGTKSSATQMNEWVANKTNNKIKEIITDADITVDTVMVLLNALYFDAKWQTPFEENMTFKYNFFLNDKDVTKVNMMVQGNFYNYSDNKELRAKFLEIPYSDPDFTMTIILPYEVSGLSKLESRIHEVLEYAARGLLIDEVIISLPKFKIEQTVQFKPILKELGMEDAFEKADFSGLTADKREMSITKIVQKTFIEVKEAGTEAASATSVVLEDRIGGPSKPYFIANHPFLFVIRQKSTGVIQFLGRFSSPNP